MGVRRAATALAGAAALVAGCSGGSSPSAAGPAGSPGVSPSPAASGSPTPGATPGPSATPNPSATPVPSATPAPSATAGRPRTAPWGRGPLLPGHILVGYAGHENARGLGILGIGPLATKGAQLRSAARPFAAPGRATVPVFEFLATLVHASAGPDKDYSSRADDALVEKYLAAARRAHAVLLLGIQPGRADFLPEVQAYERWLLEPDVGIALDPEWAVDDDELPGRSFGHTTGSELDVVATYLAGLVLEHGLPEKVMVYHQLSPRIVRDERRLHPHRGVVLIKSIDGIGSPGAKVGTYRRIVGTTPRFVSTGFKLFLEEDRDRGRRLMTPREVLALRPRPAYVVFE